MVKLPCLDCGTVHEQTEECPKVYRDVSERECPLSPTGEHEYMGNGHCKWCGEHGKGE